MVQNKKNQQTKIIIKCYFFLIFQNKCINKKNKKQKTKKFKFIIYLSLFNQYNFLNVSN